MRNGPGHPPPPPLQQQQQQWATWIAKRPSDGRGPGMARVRNVRSRCRCSMCPAIHITSRSWLRSSSTHEPSDPPLRVVTRLQHFEASGSRPNLSTWCRCGYESDNGFWVGAFSPRPRVSSETKNLGSPGPSSREEAATRRTKHKL